MKKPEKSFLSLAVGIISCASAALAQAPSAVVAQAPPRIFFTDLTSGPNTGGENNNGSIVTIYGKRFGATQGTSTVTVGGGQVAAYLQWGNLAPGRQGIQMISVAIGASAATGNIVVHTPAGDSNGVAFTVRAGNIFCISTTGSDSDTGAFPNHCWATPPKAKTAMGNGDITYIENGVTWTQADDSWQACYTLRSPHSGAAGAPKALVGYPGAVATIGSASGQNFGLRSTNIGTIAHFVFANIVWRANAQSAAVPNGVDDIRFVGNDVSCPNGSAAAGCVGPSTTNGNWYGNYIHDVSINDEATVDKLYHSVYIGDGAIHDDFAWNTIYNSHCNRGVQVYTSTPTTGGPIYDLHVHDNWIEGIRGIGLLFNAVDCSPGSAAPCPSTGVIEAYNNVIINAGRGPAFTGTSGDTPRFCMQVSSQVPNSIQVYNNTIYQCGIATETTGGGFLGSDGNLRNNILDMVTGRNYFDPGTSQTMICSTNLFFGSGIPPSQCTASINSDPLLVNPVGDDFHLLSTSPAKDAGLNTGVTGDLDGIARPQGPAYDIGAYEFYLATPAPNPPTNLTVVVH